MRLSARRAALAVGLLVIMGWGCGGDAEQEAARRTGGDPQRGRQLMLKYGCASCHVIPGVEGARGMVGPSLEGIAGRTYLAGKLPNTPENMTLWVRDPQKVSPGTAMPNLGVSEEDGRDLVAYLYTLKP
jgi:cytochrome c